MLLNPYEKGVAQKLLVAMDGQERMISIPGQGFVMFSDSLVHRGAANAYSLPMVRVHTGLIVHFERRILRK
jgi:hypothetical protein